MSQTTTAHQTIYPALSYRDGAAATGFDRAR